MTTKTMKKKPTPKRRAESKNFNLKIPTAVFDKYVAAAARRGVSVASLMISATSKDIGLA